MSFFGQSASQGRAAICLCWLCPAKGHEQSHGVASLTERTSLVTIRILKYVNDGKGRVLFEFVSIWTTWLFTQMDVGVTLNIPSLTRHCSNSQHLLLTTIKE
jgi:hypothetical protein